MSKKTSNKQSSIPNSFSQGVGVNEAIKIIGCTANSIYVRTRLGTIPFHKICGKLVFYPEELREWIDKQPHVSVQQALSNQTLENRKRRKKRMNQ